MIHGSFLQLCQDALALHEPTLADLKARYQQHASAKTAAESQQELASIEDYLPTVNDLVICDGVAVVPIHGIMVKRSQLWSGWYSTRVIVGMDHWSDVLFELRARNDIETVIIDFDTGGGQVAGTARLGDEIYKTRQEKQVIGVANEFCASAGLWCLSQCSHVVVPASGTVGSLGVYMLHFDDSEWLKEIGFVKSVIHRGKYKGLDERPLDSEAKDDLQRFIDGKYSLFIDAVARGRGLSPAEVMERWGESSLFTGSEAVSSGLADEIGTLQDVLDSLRAGHGGRVSVDVPPVDPEGDPKAMKLNAQGQILDNAGKVVGSLSELEMDAATLTKHFSAQTSELIDSAVNTAKAAAAESEKAAVAAAVKASHESLKALQTAVGGEKAIAAFIAGHSVEKAKADLADDLLAQLKSKDDELAKAKAASASGGGQGNHAPPFVASDIGSDGGSDRGAGTAGNTDGGKIDDKDAPFAADWKANKDDCQSKFGELKTYAAYRRYQSRKAG